MNLCPSSGEGGERHIFCWIPYKGLTSITGADLSKGPNRENVSFSLFSLEDRNRFNFLNVVSSSYLEVRTMDEVHNPR
jgi:hypothetical protein